MQTESILQGIFFPERQFRAWFFTMLNTCFFASSGSIIKAFGFDLDTKFPSSS
jgi:hypothetical protein